MDRKTYYITLCHYTADYKKFRLRLALKLLQLAAFFMFTSNALYSRGSFITIPCRHHSKAVKDVWRKLFSLRCAANQTPAITFSYYIVRQIEKKFHGSILENSLSRIRFRGRCVFGWKIFVHPIALGGKFLSCLIPRTSLEKFLQNSIHVWCTKTLFYMLHTH